MARRKITLNDEKIETICESVRNGNTFESAAGLARISRSLFFTWKKRGIEIRDKVSRSNFSKAEKEIYLKLITELEYAENVCIDKCTRAIVSGDKGWQARSWFLERRYHGTWGNKDKIQLDVGKETNVAMTSLAKAFNKWEKEKEKKESTPSLNSLKA